MRQKTEREIADSREKKNGAQYSKFRELLNRSRKEQKRESTENGLEEITVSKKKRWKKEINTEDKDHNCKHHWCL